MVAWNEMQIEGKVWNIRWSTTLSFYGDYRDYEVPFLSLVNLQGQKNREHQKLNAIQLRTQWGKPWSLWQRSRIPLSPVCGHRAAIIDNSGSFPSSCLHVCHYTQFKQNTKFIYFLLRQKQRFREKGAIEWINVMLIHPPNYISLEDPKEISCLLWKNITSDRESYLEEF